MEKNILECRRYCIYIYTDHHCRKNCLMHAFFKLTLKRLLLYVFNNCLILNHYPPWLPYDCKSDITYYLNFYLNYFIFQSITNRDTGETLLCVAYVFEVSTSEHGAQHHIYRLVRDQTLRTSCGGFLYLVLSTIDSTAETSFGWFSNSQKCLFSTCFGIQCHH